MKLCHTVASICSVFLAACLETEIFLRMYVFKTGSKHAFWKHCLNQEAGLIALNQAKLFIAERKVQQGRDAPQSLPNSVSKNIPAYHTLCSCGEAS